MSDFQVRKELKAACPKGLQNEFERLRRNWDHLSLENQTKLHDTVENLADNLQVIKDAVWSCLENVKSDFAKLEKATLLNLQSLIDPQVAITAAAINKQDLAQKIKVALGDPQLSAKIAKIIAVDCNLQGDIQALLDAAAAGVESALEFIVEVLNSINKQPLRTVYSPPTPTPVRQDLQRKLSEQRTFGNGAERAIEKPILAEESESSPIAVTTTQLMLDRQETKISQQIKHLKDEMNSLQKRIARSLTNSIEYIKLNGELLGLMLQQDLLIAELHDYEAMEKVC